eukprot:UN28181
MCKYLSFACLSPHFLVKIVSKLYPCSVNQSAPPKFWRGSISYFRLEFFYDVKRKYEMDPPKNFFWGGHSDLLNMGKNVSKHISKRRKHHSNSFLCQIYANETI